MPQRLLLLIVASTIPVPPLVAGAGILDLAVRLQQLLRAWWRAGLGVWIAAAVMFLAAVDTKNAVVELVSIDEAAALHPPPAKVAEKVAADDRVLAVVAAAAAAAALVVLERAVKLSLLLCCLNGPWLASLESPLETTMVPPNSNNCIKLTADRAICFTSQSQFFQLPTTN